MNDLLDIGDSIVARAGDDEQVEAVVVRSRQTEIRAYEGEVESLSSAESRGVGVRVVADQRQGFAYAGTFDEDAVGEVLDEARDNARFGEPDEFFGLAEPDGVTPPDIELWRDGLGKVAVDDKVQLALDLERSARERDPRITAIESADYADSEDEMAVVTNTGVRLDGRETSCYLSVWVIAGDDGDTRTGFGYSVGREPGDLDVDEAAGDSAARATRLLGATKPSSERVTVVLDPFVTAQFLGIVGATLSGEAVLKGRSLFADRVGEEVAARRITLVDDPTDARAYTATRNDGEGLATRRNVLIQDGVLQGFVHNTYTGRRSGSASTGSAVRGYRSTPGVGCQALFLTPGEALQPELLGRIGDGVLVADVSGLHSGVNPVSGDFSTGADGLRIRNGELAEPVKEFTIASTIQKMLRDVVEVGGDVEWLPMSAVGVSLAVADVTVSGE